MHLGTKWLSCSSAEKDGVVGGVVCRMDARLSMSEKCPFIIDEIMLGYIRRSIGRRLKELFFPSAWQW